jgi:kynurenine formamidase
MNIARRLAMSVLMSFASEGAIAQQAAQPPTQAPPAQTAPAQAASAHRESWWDSPYGEADTLGALNNLSPANVKAAAKLVKTGKVYRLGVKTGPETPAYGARTYTVERTTAPGDLTPNGSQRVTAFDERIVTSMGIGTQIDGLAHLGVDHHYYNGITSQQVKSSRILDLASIPPIVTRGVLIDMAKHFGKPMLLPGDVFNRAEIAAAAKAQGVRIRKGDVVLLHTGWIAAATTDPEAYRAREPGLGEDGANWLANLGVVAIGADTIALEVIPFVDPTRPFIVHQTLLAKHGVHILESVDTRELVKDGLKQFLFIAAPPRFEGTVQIVVNPVVIG